MRFNMDHSVRLEIALDRRFSRIVRAIDSHLSSVSVNLDEGTYWWRIYPVRDDFRAMPISVHAADISTGTLCIRRVR